MKLGSPARDLFKGLNDLVDAFEAEHQGDGQERVSEWMAEALGACLNLVSITGCKVPIARVLHYADVEQRWLVREVTGASIKPESQVKARLHVVGEERSAPPLPTLE